MSAAGVSTRILGMEKGTYHNVLNFATLICMEFFRLRLSNSHLASAGSGSGSRCKPRFQNSGTLFSFQRPGQAPLIHSSGFSCLLYCLDITPQALIILSVYPANSVCPSALHARLTHSGSLLFLPTVAYSGFSSSTLLFFSRSKMMIELDVAAHSQYRFGEKTKAWISSPAVRE